MTFLDICAGIGGFRLGLERAGHKCIGFIEKDKYAVKSYRAMYNTEGEWYADDVTAINTEEIPDADIWCFGFPCQDISIAGKQAGLDGQRSSIFFNIIELIKGKKTENRPKWILVENVKNLLSIDGGRGFARILSEMDKAGYDAEWQVLNSKNFGVPHNRERVFIIGHLRNGRTRKILPITGESSGHLKQIVGGGQGERVYSTDGISACLSAQGGGLGAKTRLYIFYNESRDSPQIRRLTPRECFRLQGFPDELFEKAEAVNSDTQLYKQEGNAVTVNVAYAIGKKLKEV